MLDIVPSCNLAQYQGKIMNQTSENGKKKLILGLILVGYVIHYYKLSLYAISRETNEPNLRKWQKELVLGPILAHFAQIWATNFFFLNLAPSVTRYHGQLSSCTTIQSWENLMTDGQKDGRTDGRTGESDFTGRCPTNAERPKSYVRWMLIRYH